MHQPSESSELLEGAVTRILEGIRVIELGTMITAPLAGMMLADLGADVIKVERPDGGDPFRSFPWRTLAARISSRSIATSAVSRWIFRQMTARPRSRQLLSWAPMCFWKTSGKGVVDRLGFDAAGDAAKFSKAGLVLDHRFWSRRALCLIGPLTMPSPAHCPVLPVLWSIPRRRRRAGRRYRTT